MNLDSCCYQPPFYVRFHYPDRECNDDIWKVTLPSAADKTRFLEDFKEMFKDPIETDDQIWDFFYIMDERLESLHKKWGALIDCWHMEETIHVF